MCIIISYHHIMKISEITGGFSGGSWLGSMLFSTQVASDAPPTKGSRHRTMQLPPGGTSGGEEWILIV